MTRIFVSIKRGFTELSGRAKIMLIVPKVIGPRIVRSISTSNVHVAQLFRCQLVITAILEATEIIKSPVVLEAKHL